MDNHAYSRLSNGLLHSFNESVCVLTEDGKISDEYLYNKYGENKRLCELYDEDDEKDCKWLRHLVLTIGIIASIISIVVIVVYAVSQKNKQ